MRIIFIAGKKRSGKDTFGALLRDELEKRQFSVYTTHLAKKLKYDVSDLLEITPVELDSYKNAGSYITISKGKVRLAAKLKELLEFYDDFGVLSVVDFDNLIDRLFETKLFYFTPKNEVMLNITYRQILQNYGDMCKELFGELVWSNMLKKDIELAARYKKIDFVIVPDYRYPYESDALSEYNCDYVKVSRSSLTNNGKEREHSSEIMFDDVTFPYEVNNDKGLLELKEEADRVARKLIKQA